jgi:hypothetical protein
MDDLGESADGRRAAPPTVVEIVRCETLRERQRRRLLVYGEATKDAETEDRAATVLAKGRSLVHGQNCL